MGRDQGHAGPKKGIKISIHSPRMGRDNVTGYFCTHPSHFNPLSPHGERPLRYAGSCSTVNFNPLSPHGERPALPGAGCACIQFQSTLPAWGETAVALAAAWAGGISIHSPRMGRDVIFDIPRYANGISIHSPRMGRDTGHLAQVIDALYFNPLSPHGERLARRASWATQQAISIHSPRMGRDFLVAPLIVASSLFQSTLPAWGETCPCALARARH